MTERYGWDQTPTPDLGLDISKAPEDIQKLYKWIIEKMYGEDVASAYGQAMVLTGILAKNAEAMSLFTSGKMDTLTTYVDDLLLEMTDKDIISAPEIIQMRDGEELAIDRIKRDLKKHQNVQSMVADVNLSSGQAVQTMGFYEEGDSGGALYVVNDNLISDGMTVIELDNGLFAELISTHKINVHQLGARGNNVSDDYPFIQKAFDMFGVVTFGNRLNYRVEQTPVINKGITVHGNYSSIFGFNCDSIKIATKWSDKCAIERLYMRRGGTQDYIGIDMDAGSWGVCAVFKEVRVVGPKIGIRIVDGYSLDLDGLILGGCKVSAWVTQTAAFSNVIMFKNIRFSEGEIGLVLENVQGSEFTTCVFEHLDIGVVLSNSTTTTKFHSPWFERIKDFPVFLGTINQQTLELTPTAETTSTLVDKSVEFINARFSDDGEGYAKQLYPTSRRFLSQYGDYNSIYGYVDSVESLIMSGVQYTNLGRTDINLHIVSPNGTVTKTTEDTPFGSKTVVTGSGIHGTNTRITSSTPAAPFTTGDYVLLKMKIKSSKRDRVYLYLADETETRISTENGFAMESVKDGWIEIATIVKITAPISTGSLYSTAMVDRLVKGTPFNIKATDISIINLTSIFGAGNEPDVSFGRKIGPYFTHATYNTTAKTGYGR